MFYGEYGLHRLMDTTTETPGMGRTSIQVSDELADELHGRKERGESYEDVIWNLIEEAGGGQNGSQSREEPSPSEPEPTPADIEDAGARSVEASVATVDFPSGKPREECVEAVRVAYEYLRDAGGASMRDFVIDVMPEHPIGYDVPDLEPGERYRGSWWRKVVKPGLQALPDVEAPASGQSEWTYVGGDDA